MSYQMTLQDSPRYLSGEYDYEVVGGDTIYYHNYPDVSSTNNLGSVASGGFLARAVPSWVVSAGTSYIAQRERAGTTDPSLVEPADGAGSFYNAATRTFEMVTPTEAEGSPYDVRDYGAVGDGTTDDTDAIQAAIDAASAVGGAEVYFPPTGRFAVGELIVRQQVCLKGVHDHTDMTDRDGWATIGSALLVDENETIKLYNGAGIVGMVIQRQGMTFPYSDGLTLTEVALYAGTAITIQSAATHIAQCSIMGFDRAVDQVSTNTPRQRMERVHIDCTNGVRVDQELGISRYYAVHCHGFLTNTDETNVRTGIAFEFKNKADWMNLTGCFSLGYATGFKVTDCNSMLFQNCGADYPKTIPSGDGWLIQGDSTECSLLGCQGASREYGVRINTDDGNRTFVKDSKFWACTGSGVIVTGGDVSVVDSHMRATVNGVAINDANSNVFVDGCSFYDLTTAIARTSASSVLVGDNTYDVISTNVESGRVTRDLASATSTTVPSDGNLFNVTGNTKIGTLVGSQSNNGRVITLIADEAITFGYNASSMQLRGGVDWDAQAGDTLTLVHDAANIWNEVSRTRAGVPDDFNVKAYGATGDGSTDDTAAIQAAIDAADAAGGGEVFLPAGTYSVQSLIDVYGVAVRGAGVDQTVIQQDYDGNVFRAIGSIGSGVALTGNAAKGALTLATTTATLSAGDYLLLSDTAAWPGTPSGATAGEIVRVKTVDSGSALTLEEPLYAAYTTANSAQVQKITMVTGTSISDLTIVNSAPGTLDNVPVAIQAAEVKDLVVKNVRFQDLDGPAIHPAYCVDFLIDGCKFDDLTNDPGNDRYGYGVNLDAGCQNSVVANCNMRGGRHLVTTGSGSAGVPRNITIANCVATEMTEGCFDCHAEGEHITFIGCQASHTWGYGFKTRASYTVFQDCHARSIYGPGFLLQFGTTELPDNCLITNCTARDLFDNTGDSQGRGVDIEGDGVLIHGLRVENAAQEGIRVNDGYTNQTIVDVLLKSVVTGINFDGTSSGHRMTNIQVDTATTGIRVDTSVTDLTLLGYSPKGTVSTDFGGGGINNLVRTYYDSSGYLQTNAQFRPTNTITSTGALRMTSASNGFFDMVEQSSDPAALANYGRVYAKDNGGGKTQLCVRFGSGAVQVLATEP